MPFALNTSRLNQLKYAHIAQKLQMLLCQVQVPKTPQGLCLYRPAQVPAKGHVGASFMLKPWGRCHLCALAPAEGVHLVVLHADAACS